MATNTTNAPRVEETKEEGANHEINYKLIIIGETGVGKTCIMVRASKDEFKEEHSVTLGADFVNYNLSINGKSIRLQMWDTCGLEMYKSMIRVFFKGSDAAFLVYDVTNIKSFETLPSWLKELREYATPEPIIYLIGNKIDREDRVITKADAEKFVSTYQLAGYYETSAKLGVGIKSLINTVGERLVSAGPKSKPEGTQLVESKKEERKKGCMC
jgi:small GTP-binding protein